MMVRDVASRQQPRDSRFLSGILDCRKHTPLHESPRESIPMRPCGGVSSCLDLTQVESVSKTDDDGANPSRSANGAALVCNYLRVTHSAPPVAIDDLGESANGTSNTATGLPPVCLRTPGRRWRVRRVANPPFV